MMDRKLMAVVAAINAYIEEEQAAAGARPGGRWARQGRLDIAKGRSASFNRPRRWR